MKITLCGSTRFQKAFSDWNAALTLSGHVVYALAMHGRQASDVGKSEDQPLVTDDEKIKLDLMHLSKIEESDAILVLNVDGYIGESTAREILWTKMRGKDVYYLNNTQIGTGCLGMSVWHIYSAFDTTKPIAVSGGDWIKSYKQIITNRP